MHPGRFQSRITANSTRFQNCRQIGDARMKSAFDAANRVRKYAAVGAPEWAAAMINLFAALTPVDAKFSILRRRDRRGLKV